MSIKSIEFSNNRCPKEEKFAFTNVFVIIYDNEKLIVLNNLCIHFE